MQDVDVLELTEEYPYTATTHGIKISVRSEYLADKSFPTDGLFVWAYHVHIENESDDTVQLLNRHWQIVDSNGLSQEVRGDGVIGEQPTLKPGATFTYCSGTHLGTSSGMMLGSYGFAKSSGKRIKVAVPAFSLDSPYARSRAN